MSPILFPFLYELYECPNLANESIDSSDAVSRSFLQYSMNSSLLTLNGEILNFFSAASSIGRPFLSRPKGNRTSKPFIRLYLAKKSM